jgi:hypothetical protein
MNRRRFRPAIVNRHSHQNVLWPGLRVFDEHVKIAVVVRGLADLSPGCKTVTRLQSEALDRKLPLRQRLGLRGHLLLCQWCRRYGKQTSPGHYARRLARSLDDVRAAQSLRFQIFNLELNDD